MTTIKTVAVCGAGGTMGAGIALVAARAGFHTICFDLSPEALARQRQAAKKFYTGAAAKGRMTEAEAEAAFSRLQDSSDLRDLADCDLVIEAIFENLEVKQQLFKKLNDICKPETIFASNTSTLSITEIAGGSGRDGQVVGMHFCLPAQVMKLIEMSRGINTTDAVFQTAWDWTKAAGQIPVETQDKPGFILNALLVPFNNDVIRALEAGLASAEDIDIALRSGLGYKMGPCTLLDMIGLDTQIRLGEAFYPITLDKRASVPPLLRRLVAAGILGNKSGRGLLSGAAPAPKADQAPSYKLNGVSAAFAPEDAFLANASTDGAVQAYLGASVTLDPKAPVVLVELGRACLGEKIGEQDSAETANVVGFARYCNGTDAPSNLIELVRRSHTTTQALDAARAIFEVAGFDVVICADQPGRIVDRLLRPKLNDALRFFDEGLASEADMDKTCAMGLGYPVGPLARVKAGGLGYHYQICADLQVLTGNLAYAPARAAVVAHRRGEG